MIMASYDMSGEDFRAHLYRSLQGKGILDSLKVIQTKKLNDPFSNRTILFSTVTVKKQVSNRIAQDNG